MRIVIIGWPKTGKTTLAKKMGGGRSTDEVQKLGWSEASAAVAEWFNAPGPWVIEGVAVPRAIRKWITTHPGRRLPIDKIIHLHTLYQPLTAGAEVMGKGIDTVMTQIRPHLQGIEIEDVTWI